MTAAPRIAFLASTAEPAQRARQELMARYGDCSIEEADVLLCFGRRWLPCCGLCIVMGQAVSRYTV